MVHVNVATVLEYTIGVLVVGFMFGMALHDTVEIFEAYWSDNTVTFANATWGNYSLDLLNASVCFELTGPGVLNESEPNIWSPNLSTTFAQARQILKEKSLFNFTMWNGTIDERAFKSEALMLSIGMIGGLSNAMGFDIGFQSYDNSIFVDSLDDILVGNNSTLLTREEFYDAHDWFVSHSQFAHDLELMVVSQLCQRFKFKFFINLQLENSIDICDPKTILRSNGHVLESSYLCIPLPLNRFGLTRNFLNYPVFQVTAQFKDIYYIPQSNKTSNHSWSRSAAHHVEDNRMMLESG